MSLALIFPKILTITSLSLSPISLSSFLSPLLLTSHPHAQVVDDQGHPALGAGRSVSGICGGPIRAAAVDWVLHARKAIRDERLDLALVGCGGIMLPEQFDEFLRVGADVAMSATGMMWDPFLALRYHELHASKNEK
jgi:hypothetical protein